LSIPNTEIRNLFTKKIKEWFSDVSKNDGKTLEIFCNAFIEKKPEKIEQLFGDYLWNTISIRDTAIAKEKKENFYHGTVFGMLAILSDRYYISSNRESGEGRFDIQLEPKDKSQLGYIIEFKAGKNLSDTELANSASSAIQQIQSKKYSTDMEYHGIKKIGLFGIAFSGKRVAAKYEEIQLHS